MEHDTEKGPGEDAINTEEEPRADTTDTEAPGGGGEFTTTQDDTGVTYLALWTPPFISA